MTDQPTEQPLNLVRLRGRLSSDPQERELPSGTALVTFRLVMPRHQPPRTAGTKGSSARSDWVVCAVWTARLRRSVLRWAPGDLVEVSGALRRRQYRREGVSGSTVEVEVTEARRVRPAGTDAPQSGGDSDDPAPAAV